MSAIDLGVLSVDRNFCRERFQDHIAIGVLDQDFAPDISDLDVGVRGSQPAVARDIADHDIVVAVFDGQRAGDLQGPDFAVRIRDVRRARPAILTGP